MQNELKEKFALIKKGDKVAFKMVFDTYYPRLYSFSLKYGVDQFGAEEITENTFIKLWQKRQKIDKITSPKSYLYKMVANASINYLKANNKNIPLDIAKHDYTVSMKEFIIEEEVHNALFNALASLPSKCRKVFELSCIEGLKYKEIAEDLNISVNTVKSQRARAIELLKAQLKDVFFLLFL